MNFKDFLNESYKTSISKDEAIDIIRKNDPSNILYRGMTSSDDFLILNGELVAKTKFSLEAEQTQLAMTVVNANEKLKKEIRDMAK